MLISSKKQLFSNETLMDNIRIIILVLCLLILAIPEGMPLAISIAMAMSVDTMKEDNILIKNIECVQVCALLHEICVGKTGTLTEGNLHVGSYQLISEPKVHQNNWGHPTGKTEFNNIMKIADRITANANDNIKGLLREAILANTDVRIEVEEKQVKDDDGNNDNVAT
jgi:P-type E1-E2 ATPase